MNYHYGYLLMFKKKQHNLPKFPPAVLPTFEKLCIEIPEEEIPELMTEYREVCKKRGEAAQKNPLFDKVLAAEIQNRCEQLLLVYPRITSAHRKLVIGAVRYCAAIQDGFSEDTFAAGLRDDAQVINYVLEEIGIEDAFIELQK